MELVDYKVRIVPGAKGTDAVTRVLIQTDDANGSWSTVGVHENVIVASWLAIVDAIDYGLMRAGVLPDAGVRADASGRAAPAAGRRERMRIARYRLEGVGPVRDRRGRRAARAARSPVPRARASRCAPPARSTTSTPCGCSRRCCRARSSASARTTPTTPRRWAAWPRRSR